MRSRFCGNWGAPIFWFMVTVAPIAAWLCCQTLQAGVAVATYGSYFGGSSDETGIAVAFDASGNLILVGATRSPTLPGTANAFQPTPASGFPNNTDVFVAKFDPSGKRLLWATYLGGDGDDVPTALSVDQSGNILVLGTTSSTNFPTTTYVSCQGGTVALQQQCSKVPPANATAFLAKLSPDGSALLYSVGITGGQATALIVDQMGTAYLAIGGFDGLYVLHLDASGNAVIYGTFLGGGGFNASETSISSLALDEGGNVWVSGSIATEGISLPTTANALQQQQSNEGLGNSIGPLALNNGFILQLAPNGSQVLYGTYVGPRYDGTNIASLALASDGSLYFAGYTNATSFQATPGAYLSLPGAGYIAKLTPGASAFDSFSYFVGAPLKIRLGADKNVYCLVSAYANSPEEYIGLMAPGLALASIAPVFGAADFAVTSSLSTWLVGTAENDASGGSFITPNALQPAISGASDALIAEVTVISPEVFFIGSSATGTSPFAAGQLISIYGTQLGPTTSSGTQIEPDGAVTATNDGTQVLFDGVAAPILFTSATQINVAVPCSVAGQPSTQMVVDYLGAKSAPLTVPLSVAAPGIFTDDGSGTGQGAVLNQDYSLNGPGNPAPRGSIAIFYATGIGLTSPCVDGRIYQSSFPTLTLPVVVGVGHTGAHVLYGGQAPDIISGVGQFNIVIPNDVATGEVPLTLVVGGVFSKSGVTIAVK